MKEKYEPNTNELKAGVGVVKEAITCKKPQARNLDTKSLSRHIRNQAGKWNRAGKQMENVGNALCAMGFCDDGGT